MSCVDGMKANEHKVGNFRAGEDTAADIQGQTTQGRNPLYDVCKGWSQSLQRTSNLGSPSAGWVLVEDVFWLPYPVLSRHGVFE